jgi:hypothetical protein
MLDPNAGVGTRSQGHGLFVRLVRFRLLIMTDEGISNLPAYCEAELILKTSTFLGSPTLSAKTLTGLITTKKKSFMRRFNPRNMYIFRITNIECGKRFQGA